jgi:phosphatidate cytidylyltransferase
MESFLRSLTTTQQIGALFLVVFGVLSLVTLWAFVRGLRETRQDARRRSRTQGQAAPARAFADFLGHGHGVLGRLGAGRHGSHGAVRAGGFFALREFITLSPTRRGDHRSLVLAFFVVLPLQFVLVGTRHFDLFTVFIPVYVFLALPVVSALANDPQRFLERNAKLQWGIMVCVYGMSHVPALLLLDFPGYRGAAPSWCSSWCCGADLHGGAAPAGAALAAPARGARISQSFQWASWLAGVAVGAGGRAAVVHHPVQAGAGAGHGIAGLRAAGSLGHLVMKALKRDRGVTSWGMQGQSVTGAGGLLDRVDALCFAAPVFFHSVRWYFGL